jgi:hypothetical protein
MSFEAVKLVLPENTMMDGMARGVSLRPGWSGQTEKNGLPE